MGTLSKNLSLTLLHAKGQGQGQMTLQFRFKKKHRSIGKKTLVDDDDDDYNDNVTCTSHAFFFENEPLGSVSDYTGPASFSSSVTWIYTKYSRWETRAVIFKD